MKVFVDANILVAVLNEEYPLYIFSVRLLNLNAQNNFQIITSPICLAIAWYFSEKKWGTKTARRKTETMCAHIEIAPSTKEHVYLTTSNKAIHDFEDGLEYYAAIDSACNCIVTDDTGDFYFSQIPVYTPTEFFMQKPWHQRK